MHALSRLRARIGNQQVDFAAPAAGGHDHPFAGAELHLPRGQVGGADHQPADKVFGLVHSLDAGQHRAAVVAAEAEREF